jgi:phosphoglycolate phosphatase-like HAD superfamily hydrolase
VPSLVQRLSAANSGLAVVSCKLRALVEAELDAAGLRKYFDVVIGFEDVDPPKPAPEPLLEAMNRLGTGRANTLYVGDSMVDLQAGESARIKTVLAAWGLAPEIRASFKHHKLWAVRPSRLLELALALPTPNGNGHGPLPNGHGPVPNGDNRAA